MTHGTRIFAVRDLTGDALRDPREQVTVSANTAGVTRGHYDKRMIVEFDGLPGRVLVEDKDIKPIERLEHIHE